MLGTDQRVLISARGEILEMLPANGGRPVMLPFTRAIVPVVDLKAGRIVAEPPVFVEGEEGELSGEAGSGNAASGDDPGCARMSWSASVLTLFPDMFPGPLGLSLAGDALKRGLWSLEAHDIREHGRAAIAPSTIPRRAAGRAW